MSSMKKNVLAVALVAGLGLAGGAAAYNYGTHLNDDGANAPFSNAALADPENVSYEMLVATSYKWTMQEGIVFDIETDDNAVSVTEGFTVRIALNQRCSPHGVETNPASPPSNVGVCTATGDGAQFDPSIAIAPGDLVLDPALVGQWQVTFDGYTSNNTVATFRIEPLVPNPTGPGVGLNTITFTWYNAHLASLNEFAATAAAGGSAKVDAEFWMVNVSNDARFVNSTMSRTILESRAGVVACATPNPAEIDKYIDVADNFNEQQIPKTRFSWDGRLGSATDAATVAAFQLPAGDDYNAQVIDLGDVTLGTGAVTGTGTFTYWGTGNAYNGVADVFKTVVDAGGGNDWNAFDNVGDDDDVYLVNGTCTSGIIIDQGTVTGSTVTFIYNADEIEAAQAGFINVGGVDRDLTVCGYVDTDTIIDDHNNQVVTTFYRVGMYPANGTAPGDTGTGYPTPGYASGVGSKVMGGADCKLLPLRYNGSTMEIFTINPGSNTSQESFIRLTNRSSTDGWVRLEGIDDAGMKAASQVSVWVPANSSIQVKATHLEGTEAKAGVVGGWGTGTGKWRAVVTAEFPGLVASSYVRGAVGQVLSNVTDSDTRGEQADRDFSEGTFASEPGERPSDFAQEFEPDFHGDGEFDGPLGGPDNGADPSGGSTDPTVPTPADDLPGNDGL